MTVGLVITEDDAVLIHTNQSAALLPQLSSRTGHSCFLAAHCAVVALVCSMPTKSQNDSSLGTSRLVIAILDVIRRYRERLLPRLLPAKP
jgi:hypothetical protein